MANVDYPIAGSFFVGPEARGMLNNISMGLERANEKIAYGIATGRIGGPGLDAKLVHTEQSMVQAGLDAFAKQKPDSYRTAINEMNGLLNSGGVGRFAGSQFASDRRYMSVLDGVREKLGRDIDFGRQADREAIGLGLIRSIRMTGVW